MQPDEAAPRIGKPKPDDLLGQSLDSSSRPCLSAFACARAHRLAAAIRSQVEGAACHASARGWIVAQSHVSFSPWPASNSPDSSDLPTNSQIPRMDHS
jgi:hypothetical protein